MPQDQLMNLLQQGSGILVQIAVFVAIILLRDFKDHVQNYYVSHTTTKQRELLSQLGREAFVFAETVYNAYDGPAKLNEATKYLLEKAKGLGLNDVELSDARAVIESAWLQDKRLLTAPTVAYGTNTVAGTTAMAAATNTTTQEAEIAGTSAAANAAINGTQP